MRAIAILNLALLGAIAALVVPSRKQAAAASPDPSSGAFVFPTHDSHASIDLSDESLDTWSTALGCTRTEIVRAMGVVGTSEHAVREYLARPA